jgi:hypothetical protein
VADDPVQLLKKVLGVGGGNPEIRRLDDLLHGKFEPPYLPSDGSSAIEREYSTLVKRSELPVLGMIVRAVADRLIVDGVTLGDEPQSDLWRWWQRSSFDQRQALVYSDALSYGNGYILITPGADGPLFTPESPLALRVEHDPLDPMGVTVAAKQVGDDAAWLYTDEAIYAFERTGTPQQWTVVSEYAHGLGVVPVVRCANRQDSLGRSFSEVLEVLPIQRRINQTVFARLLLEASAAWRQRWVAGIDIDHDDEGRAIPPFRMGVDKLLTAPDSDTKFGEFSASSTQDLLAAIESDLRHIAVVCQVPPTLFAVTSVSNISSESLAALEGGLTRKVAQKQQAFGECLEYAMRLGGRLVGEEVDEAIEVSWRDTEISSISQRSNAFVQLRGGGLPIQWLAEEILNLSPQSVERLMGMVEAEIRAGVSTVEVTHDSPDTPDGGNKVDNKVMHVAEPMLRGQG